MVEISVKHLLAAVCVFFVLLVGPGRSQGDWPELLSRLPESPNAVAIFEVEALRNWAAKEDVADGDKKPKSVGGLSVELTRDLQRGAVAASVDLDRLEPTWEVSIFELTRVPTTERLAETERGYIDRIAGKSLVWSPRRVYMLPLDPSHLAVVEPANRQMLGKWLQKLGEKASGLTPYLERAAGYSSAEVPVVVAMDLAGVFAPAPLRDQLATFGALRRTNTDLNQLAQLFSEMDGFIFAVQIKNGLRGKLQLDFKDSAAPLEKVGKTLLLDMLTRGGAVIEDIKEWNPQVSGNTFSLSGPLSATGLQQVMSFFNSLNAAERVSDSAQTSLGAPAPTPEPAAQASRSTQQGEASRRYFQSVKKIVNEDRKFEAGSLGERATWTDRLSRKIDDLPQLNVDPELLDYGTEVGRLLRDAGFNIRTANLEAGVAKAGTHGSTVNSVGVNVGGIATGWVNRPSHYNSQTEATRRQKGTTAHIKNLQAIDDMTGQIRRKMTERYQIEF